MTRPLVGVSRAPRERGRAGHRHTRGAEPALHAPLCHQRLLERVQRARPLQPLHGHDLVAVRGRREHEAGGDGSSVEQHDARAALSGAAAFLGAGEAGILADEVEKPASGRDLEGAARAVERHLHDDALRHGRPLEENGRGARQRRCAGSSPAPARRRSGQCRAGAPARLPDAQLRPASVRSTRPPRGAPAPALALPTRAPSAPSRSRRRPERPPAPRGSRPR